jgi:hypothetical protein
MSNGDPGQPTSSSPVNPQDQLRQTYKEYLSALFQRALENGKFNFILTILRYDGMSFGMWDPLVEADEALTDFSELIQEAGRTENRKRLIRLNLLIYCHATEMSAPYHILYNVLRCANGKLYKMQPFAHLIRSKKTKKKILLGNVPPSPRAKIRELQTVCESDEDRQLIEILESFLNEDIRNAFYHSDYCIDLVDECFNITEGGYARRVPLNELNKVLTEAFAFYEAFFQTYYGFKKLLARSKRFHEWANYEVLELLSNEQEGLYGFTIHISNGNQCTFERHKDNVIAQNVMFEDEGFSLQIGSLDDLRKEWLVRGEPYRDS